MLPSAPGSAPGGIRQPLLLAHRVSDSGGAAGAYGATTSSELPHQQQHHRHHHHHAATAATAATTASLAAASSRVQAPLSPDAAVRHRRVPARVTGRAGEVMSVQRRVEEVHLPTETFDRYPEEEREQAISREDVRRLRQALQTTIAASSNSPDNVEATSRAQSLLHDLDSDGRARRSRLGGDSSSGGDSGGGWAERLALAALRIRFSLFHDPFHLMLAQKPGKTVALLAVIVRCETRARRLFFLDKSCPFCSPVRAVRTLYCHVCRDFPSDGTHVRN